MAIWRFVCLASFGALAGYWLRFTMTPIAWGVLFGVGALGWCWSAIFSALSNLRDRAMAVITGRRPALPEDDPRVLAGEMRQLSQQLTQLRETATGFDISFDKALDSLDARLQQVEKRNEYVAPQQVAGSRY